MQLTVWFDWSQRPVERRAWRAGVQEPVWRIEDASTRGEVCVRVKCSRPLNSSCSVNRQTRAR